MMTAATTTQSKTTEGGTQEPPIHQKQAHQLDVTTPERVRRAESPRVDSHKAQTFGTELRTSTLGSSSSIPVPTGFSTWLTRPPGLARRGHDEHSSSPTNLHTNDRWREPSTQTPLTPAFASLHPYSTVGQPLRQRSISAPGLPRTHERSRPNLPPNLELDDNRDEVSDVEDAEDPMDVLERCEDSIWEASPFRNPRPREKIR
jgi:hypothetical protein